MMEGFHLFFFKKPALQNSIDRLKRNGEKNTFMRFLYTYMIITVFTVLIITLVLYQIYSASSIKEINSISVKMLSQTRYSADFIWSLASSDGYGIYSDSTISHAMYTKNFDLLTQALVDRKLTQAIAANPLIHSIYVHNGHTGRLISSITSALDEDDFFDSGIMQYLKEEKEGDTLEFFPRKAVFNLYNQSISHNFITLVIKKSSYDSDSSSTLIINISSEKFDKFIQSMNQEKDCTIFIIDENSKIISHTDSDKFLSDFSSMDYINEIMSSGEQEGSFIRTIEGEESLVTYVYLKRLNWWFVSMIPYNVALKPVLTTRNTLIVIALLILFSAIAIDFFATKKLYSPIRELVNSVKKTSVPVHWSEGRFAHNDFEYLSSVFSTIMKQTAVLEERFKNNAQFIKNEMLKNILLDNYPALENIQEKFEELGIKTGQSNLVVYILSINSQISANEHHTEESMTQYRYYINEIASKITNEYFPCEGADMGDNQVAIILDIKSRDAEYVSTIKKVCAEIISSAKKYLSLSITAGIGSYCDTLDELYKSYMTAKENLNYGLVFGPGSIITEEMSKRDSKTKYSYPEDTEKNILNSLKLRKAASIETYLLEFMNAISQFPYNDIVLSLIHLANSSIDTISVLGVSQNDCLSNLRNVLDIIKSSNSLGDIQSWYMKIYESTIHSMNMSKATHKETIVAATRKYIDGHFTDPILSIDAIAEKVNLSTNYLRTVFNEVEGKTISDYINDKRFEMAYELLITSNYSTIQIAKMTGFNSTTYFYTSFKKRVGITPDSFRKSRSLKSI